MAVIKHSNQLENQEAEATSSQEAEIKPIPVALEATAESFEAKEAERTTEVGPTEERATEPSPAPALAAKTLQTKSIKDKDLLAVENILAENLAEAFSQLSLEKQAEFKAEGEKVANTIWQMVESAKIQVKKVMDLIKNWIKKLPGINRFFLEQEAKLKTDKIIALARLHSGENKKHGAER